MTDRFDIQRRLDNAGNEPVNEARRLLEEEREAERARKARLVRLTSGYYYDPVEKALLRKEGSQFGFVRHDRRHERELKATQAEAEARGFRMVAGGLFWDEKLKKLYRKSGRNFVLYTGDRRKSKGPDRRKKRAGGRERRKPRG
jgi:hypothetical protein